MTTRALIVAVLLGCVGCSSPWSAASNVDADVDVASGADADVDAGADGSVDADAEVDAGADGSADAEVDAGADPDAGGAMTPGFKYLSTDYGTWPGQYLPSLAHYGMGDGLYNNQAATSLAGKTLRPWDESDNEWSNFEAPSNYADVTSPAAGYLSYYNFIVGHQPAPPASNEVRVMILGRDWFQHYVYGAGLPVPMIVGAENGAGTGNWQSHMAFSRGAARQLSDTSGQKYEWIMDYSSWHGTSASRYEYYTHDGNTWCLTCGHSRSIRNRHNYMAWMGGADYIHDEGLGADGFTTPAVDGVLQLTVHGQVVKDFTDFIAANPDRGTAVVPMAVVLNRYHGISDSWSTGLIWQKLAFSSGDWWTYNVFNQILWPSGFNHTPYSHSENQDMVNEPAWGDGIDVLTEDATQTTLSNYSILVVLGDCDQSTLLPKLQTHLSQGKRVVLSPSLSTWGQYLTPYGAAYVPGDLPTTREHLNAAYGVVKPFTVSGAVSHQIALRSDSSYLISLMNNLGVTKEHSSSTDQIINPAHDTEVTITPNPGEYFAVTGTKLLGTNDFSLSDCGAIHVVVPAGEVTILRAVKTTTAPAGCTSP